MYTDNNVKFGYDPITGISSFPINHIGAGGHYLIEEEDYLDTDANTIHVSDTVGNDTTGNGTRALPYKTLLKGANECTTDKTKVLVLDSATYTEDLSGMSLSYIVGFYADSGQTPYYNIRVLGYTDTDANTIYVSKTGLDANAGTRALPKLTLTSATGAISAVDATHQNIMIIDSGTYVEETFEMTGNFVNLYADLLCTPVLQFTKANDSIDYTDNVPLIGVGEIKIDDISASIANCKVRQFSNGTFAILWMDGFDDTLYIRTIDASGVTLNTETLSTCNSQNFDMDINSNDIVCCFWRDKGNAQIRIIFYDTGLNIVSGPTSLGAQTASAFTEVYARSNDDFILACSGIPVANYQVDYWIYADDGTSVLGKTNIRASGATQTLGVTIGELSNNDYIIGYSEFGANRVYYKRYNSSDVLQNTVTVSNTDTALYMELKVLENDFFVIIWWYSTTGVTSGRRYNNTDTPQAAQFAIMNSTNISGRTLSSANTLDPNKYIVTGGYGNQLYYTIYDNTDAQFKADAQLAYNGTLATADGVNDIHLLSDGTYAVIYNSNQGGGDVVFIRTSLFSCPAIECSVASNINGPILDINDVSLINKAIKINGAKPTIKGCTIKNCTNTANPNQYGYAVHGDNEVDVFYCRIHDCGGGILTVDNASLFHDNLIYRIDDDYGIQIDGAAAVLGDIAVEHCTFFECASGIYLENNNGTNEIVKNNIFHDCFVNDIKTDNGITFDNTVYTGNLDTATPGADTVTINPTFINEGVINPLQTDLHLKVSELGYPVDSSAKDLADDSRDAGAYYVFYFGEAEAFTFFTMEKPGEIDRKVSPVGDTDSDKIDGNYESSVEGWNEEITFSFEGVLNADLVNIEKMFLSGKNTVRIYFDPDTFPYTYSVYKIKYDDIEKGAAHYKLTRTGVEGLEITFKRKYEII